MEQITNFFQDAIAYVAVVVAFITGLIADFKSYSRTKRILIVAAAPFVIVIAIAILRAVFG